MTVRTRFAPSPTGVLHIGNARTALFNWLLARHTGGKLALRIEDTDKERSTAENVNVILDGLRWLGVEWDEGPVFQSERAGLYQAAVDKLIASGGAYRCRCTTEELAAKRAAAEAHKQTFVYDRSCRDKHYGPEQPFVVRCAMPIEGVSVVEDLIKGRVEVNYAELDDWVMVRSDGTPTYNFCVVVDDADMGVTHVVRGEDHLTNTHKQLPLYRHLGLTPPRFGHMPLTLGKDRAKLSKRHGAANLLDYREMGYLPQAMRNFLVRLGWAHGDQELFTDEELIRLFEIAEVSASNAIFDLDKLNWINGAKIRESTPEDLVEPALPFLRGRGYAVENDARLRRIIGILQARSTTLVDMAERARIFYLPPEKCDEKALKKWWKPESKAVLRRFLDWLRAQPELIEAEIMPFLEGLAKELGFELGQVAQPIRIALTGSAASPPLEETIAIIGRDAVIARVERALAELPE
jgi:glutamyl-tRNA synthetase